MSRRRQRSRLSEEEEDPNQPPNPYEDMLRQAEEHRRREEQMIRGSQLGRGTGSSTTTITQPPSTTPSTLRITGQVSCATPRPESYESDSSFEELDVPEDPEEEFDYEGAELPSSSIDEGFENMFKRLEEVKRKRGEDEQKPSRTAPSSGTTKKLRTTSGAVPPVANLWQGIEGPPVQGTVIRLRRQASSSPQMASPAPPTDDPELTEEDRQYRQLYNRMRSELEQEREEEEDSDREDLTSQQLGQILADKHRRLVAQQRADKSKRKSKLRKDLKQAKKDWRKKRPGFLDIEHEPLQRQDMPQLCQSLDVLSLRDKPRLSPERPISEQQDKEWSVRDITDPRDPRIGSSRKFHSTRCGKFNIPQECRQGVSLNRARRLMPNFQEQSHGENVWQRMNPPDKPYELREHAIDAVKRELSHQKQTASFPVEEYDRAERRLRTMKKSELPCTVKILDRWNPRHRDTIPEDSDEDEEEEEEKEEEKGEEEEEEMEQGSSSPTDSDSDFEIEETEQ